MIMLDDKAARQVLEALEYTTIGTLSGGNDNTKKAIASLRQALEQPKQKPVLQDIEQYRMQMAGICTAAIGYWKEADGIHPDYDTVALRDVAKLYAKYDALYKAQPKQEPFEYWNAVEGWVKIDEVREHFDSVGCGTIYKTAGEGRVPLAIAQPKQEPVGDDWTPCIKLPVVVHVRNQRPDESHVSTREGITPVKPDDLIMRGVSGEEYPIGRAIFEQTYSLDTRPQALEQPKHEPTAWYDKNGMITHDPFEGVVPLYTEPTKRKWVGLTREEKSHILNHSTTVASAVKAIETKLREKNA